MAKEYITSTKAEVDANSGVDSSGSLEGVDLYGSGGKVDKDDKNCYAKSHKFKNPNGEVRYTYYIKCGRDGSLFNPWGMYTEGTESKVFGGDRYWRFKSVNKKCFELYVRFLESRKNSLILNAEREIK